MAAETPEWTARKVRETFVNFMVEKHGHTYVPSSPVIPHNDPTLLFTTAGMVQFKQVFLGQLPENHPWADLKRACNWQRCIRAGGKHNDLDDVGVSQRHHSSFQMLGNWSFGDYFKKEAIAMAWELMTEVYKLDPQRLYATYFEGDPEDNIPADLETRDIWLQYLPESHVVPGDKHDNWWSAGDIGPCGGCSELHYDIIGGGREVPELVNQDDPPEVLELWNNVFMEFNRDASGELRPLPAKHVDTGMGFERVVAVLQNKLSNYDTDVFTQLFAAIQEETGAEPYGARFGDDDVTGTDTAYRVVADHIRTLTYAVTDGAVPSNEGRGYVLRRILRRAVRFGKAKLGAKLGFFSRLVPVVVDAFAGEFPELTANPQRVVEIIADEEVSFSKTLDRGISRFERMVEGKDAGHVISGHDAALLYDSFGFPVDLTQIMAEERGMSVDVDGFNARMDELREISRSARKRVGADAGMTLSAEMMVELADTHNTSGTDDSAKYVWNSGDGSGDPVDATISAIFLGHNKFAGPEGVEGADGRLFGLLLDRTSFYAESGGQVFDTGSIIGPDGARFSVEDVQPFGRYVLHVGSLAAGAKLKAGDSVSLRVDYLRRALIAKNHTVTHLLNFALREVVGEEVDQRGSLCDEERCRFDFATGKALSNKQLQAVQDIVSRQIDEDLAVYVQEVPLERAQKVYGLRAVFGERYPDPVRVVSVGQDITTMIDNPENSDWANFSVEFCGGTHLASSGEASRFIIVSCESISKGVRRINAYTADKAQRTLDAGEELIQRVISAQSLQGEELTNATKELTLAVRVATLAVRHRVRVEAELKKLRDIDLQVKKALAAKRSAAAIEQIAELATQAAEANSDFVVAVLEVDANTKAMKAAAKSFGKVAKETALALLSPDPESGKLAAFFTVPKSKQDKLPAKDWLAAAMAVAGGRGGGKAAQATGQSKDGASKLDDAVNAAEEHAKSAFAE